MEPYLTSESILGVVAQGLPIMRPMLLEFPKDNTSWYLDQQYMLGSSLLVAPVFGESAVDYYVPKGTWTNILDGSEVTGPAWVSEAHTMLTLPILLRPDTALVLGTEGHSVLDSITQRGFVVVVTKHIAETLVNTVALRDNKELVVKVEPQKSGVKVTCVNVDIGFSVIVIGSGKGLDDHLESVQAINGGCEVTW